MSAKENQVLTPQASNVKSENNLPLMNENKILSNTTNIKENDNTVSKKGLSAEILAKGGLKEATKDSGLQYKDRKSEVKKPEEYKGIDIGQQKIDLSVYNELEQQQEEEPVQKVDVSSLLTKKLAESLNEKEVFSPEPITPLSVPANKDDEKKIRELVKLQAELKKWEADQSAKMKEINEIRTQKAQVTAKTKQLEVKIQQIKKIKLVLDEINKEMEVQNEYKQELLSMISEVNTAGLEHVEFIANIDQQIEDALNELSACNYHLQE